MKKFFIILLCGMMALSCSKKQTDNTLANKTALLTTGTWRLTDYYYHNALGSQNYSSLPDCIKDNYDHYNNDGTGETNEGLTKCNSANPQTRSIQWRFLNNNASKIEIDGFEYVVDRLEGYEFRFRSSSNDPYAPETIKVYSR